VTIRYSEKKKKKKQYLKEFIINVTAQLEMWIIKLRDKKLEQIFTWKWGKKVRRKKRTVKISRIKNNFETFETNP
jgi:hypothetical protein